MKIYKIIYQDDSGTRGTKLIYADNETTAIKYIKEYFHEKRTYIHICYLQEIELKAGVLYI